LIAQHPETAITLRLKETGTASQIAHVSKERSVLQGLMFTKPQAKTARQQREMETPGIYLLWASAADVPDEEIKENHESQLDHLYIGVAGDPEHRLGTQSGTKAAWETWTNAAIFTTANNELDRSQAEYVEKRLIQRAAQLKRVNLRNVQGKKRAEAGKNLKLPKLKSGAQDEAEYFYKELLLILHHLGIHAFRDTALPKGDSIDKIDSKTEADKALFLTVESKSVEATGQQEADGFLVLEDSYGALSPANHFKPPMAAAVLREDLIDAGVIQLEADRIRVTQDFLFSSPSAAASVLKGSSTNGGKEWRNSAGICLNDLLEAGEIDL
jgi:hypothetical protein